jgi:small subunit ribosomal protein S6
MSTTLGKLREYETVVVVQPDLPEETVKHVFSRLEDALKKSNGEVLREDSWGKKKLAYEMKTHPRGNFLMMHYVTPADGVFEIERTIRNTDGVLRFVTHRLGEVTDIEAKKAEVERLVRERAKKKQEQEAAEAARAAEAEAQAEGHSQEAGTSEQS